MLELITYASPSHRPMAERFVLANAMGAGFNQASLFTDDQRCETGLFNAPGFIEAMHVKLDILASRPVGNIVCYVDADCILFPGFGEYCSALVADAPENTILFADDRVEFGMGVVAYKQTETTVEWWRFLRQFSWITHVTDQAALHGLRHIALKFPVGMQVIDKNHVVNWPSVAGDRIESTKVWTNESFQIPSSTVCFHANFCIGVENKTRMLELAEMQYLTQLARCA